MANEAPRSKESPPVLTRLAVKGFKSHYDWNEIEFRTLTILAGANSSGKSSIMQPLLLLKQTIDALPLDAGALKMEGPNVQFSNANQFLSHDPIGGGSTGFNIKLALSSKDRIELEFSSGESTVDIQACTYDHDGEVVTVRRGENPASILKHSFFSIATLLANHLYGVADLMAADLKTINAARLAFFLLIPSELQTVFAPPDPVLFTIRELQQLIHLSGLRGNPMRAYSRVAMSDKQPGLFHERAMSLLASWAEHSDPRLAQLNDALFRLGLTGKVVATAREATSVEVKVSRTLGANTGGATDMVSVADVGFGVSQSLPVVIALIAAAPGQLVYIEQPEIHLHPRAQKILADLIADAARRGVRLIIETHSDVILSRLQWNIARKENNLPPDQVIAHWFERDPDTGASRIRSSTPDETGAFGDWPVDFADVAAEVDSEYAQAAFDRLPPTEP